MFRKICILLAASLLIGLVFCVGAGGAFAESSLTLKSTNYEIQKKSDYDIQEGEKVTSFRYGDTSLSELRIIGDVEPRGTKYGYPAYGVYGAEFDIVYEYSEQLKSDNDNTWKLVSDGSNSVNGIGLGHGFWNDIDNGAVIIQKSEDGKKWKNAFDPMTDYFSKTRSEQVDSKRIDKMIFRNGMYYKVTVAYKIKKQKEEIKCVEIYTFYVASNDANVTFVDIATKKKLQETDQTDAGFFMERNESINDVSVRLPDGKQETITEFTCYTAPGDYVITVKTPLESQYRYMITVKEGLDFTALTPSVYEFERDEGFKTDGKGQKTPASMVTKRANTRLTIATVHDTKTIQSGIKVGISGSSVSLYLSVNDFGSGYDIVDDDWGKKDKQKVNGIQTGPIGKGALTIEKSNNGKWVPIDNGKYAKGLYTTDYLTHYSNGQSTLIYTPDGNEILNGVNLRISFAYHIRNGNAEKKQRDKYYLEQYTVYLCSRDLDAVTFKNLTGSDSIGETMGDQDETMITVYRAAESLTDGSCTTTGFTIDTSLNPTVTYLVTRAGKGSKKINGNTFVENDRYEITLKNAFDEKKTVTLYIDNRTEEEEKLLYFGEKYDGQFIGGKRIYSEDRYPVFEGGQTYYHLEDVPGNTLCLSGTLKNLDTGTTIRFDGTGKAQDGVIREPGMYEAVLANNPGYFTEDYSGDAVVFSSRFRVIEEGTAPGPRVNQQKLEEYSRTTSSDVNPIYYGLTFMTAGKGKVTLAFASRDAAFEYAYNFEKGLIEEQEDGSYRYSGTFISKQKTEYDSAWDRTEAMNRYAEAAVEECFFDHSDPFTYRTLKDEVTAEYENLRKLELQKSVTIFAEDQKEDMVVTDCLPIINDKPCACLDIETGKTIDEPAEFCFVTDSYGGIDSCVVSITDHTGKEYEIKYNESVGKQLEEQDCPSGILTIHEETMYQDSVEYQAVYLAPGNPFDLKLYVTNEGKGKNLALNSGSTDEIRVDTFRLDGIDGMIDPYPLIIVREGENKYLFGAGDIPSPEFTDAGRYTVKWVDRVGNSSTSTIVVTGDASAADKTEKEPHEEGEAVQTTSAIKPDQTDGHANDQEASTGTAADNRNEKGSWIWYLLIGIVILGSAYVFARQARKNKK